MMYEGAVLYLNADRQQAETRYFTTVRAARSFARHLEANCSGWARDVRVYRIEDSGREVLTWTRRGDA